MPHRIDDILIRSELRAGDIGTITFLHGFWYQREYGFGISFEAYVARGLSQFYESYYPVTDRVWVCEHDEAVIGFLLLQHRGDDTAQLRYFFLHPDFRKI